ncbi:cadherin-related tumor suppressor-like [Ptychodera flava]|uniref:cadherin-related tumor suppressor-like n=1 Tax=Ptychodera flava TaxID=63121 RepID=UPI00396A2AD4
MLTGIHVEVLLVFSSNIVYDIACERTVNHAHSDVGGQMDLPCSYEVIVREDTPVGEVIFTLPRKQSDAIGSTTSETSIYRNSSSNVHPVFESIRLADGNKNERFRVESETGDISVQGYLDHDIDSEYVLQILLQTSQNKSHSTCTVKTIIEDVQGWPLFYNETCAMPTRKQEKGVVRPRFFYS